METNSSRNRTRGKRPLRHLAPEDKLRAIERIHSGQTKASVARDIAVPESTLRGWCKNEQKLRFLCHQLKTETVSAPIKVVSAIKAPLVKRPRFTNNNVNRVVRSTGLLRPNATNALRVGNAINLTTPKRGDPKKKVNISYASFLEGMRKALSLNCVSDSIIASFSNAVKTSDELHDFAALQSLVPLGLPLPSVPARIVPPEARKAIINKWTKVLNASLDVITMSTISAATTTAISAATATAITISAAAGTATAISTAAATDTVTSTDSSMMNKNNFTLQENQQTQLENASKNVQVVQNNFKDVEHSVKDFIARLFKSC